ncbi:NAD(P)/FAD-dependent oxidoreductase [Novosphingobium sp.]|uniref:NAD(P)/FAD-dependent oxidoreductase n=1 Tax=Novosphingobium sp. TaxID=1874826 RepID=UPI0035B35BAC
MSDSVPESIAIVGANLAGGRAAEELRRSGYEGRLVLIGEEPWPPYERPPLSKEFLWNGGVPPDPFFLHDEAWYRNNAIDVRLGMRADALDLAGGGVQLASGELVRADRIMLATGASARRLPVAGAEAENVHHLRTRSDAEGLVAALRPGARIVVVGMGVIGAEIAASARKLGCEVTAIEPGAAPMARMLGARFGTWLAGLHEAQGVSLRLGVVPEALVVDDGWVRAVDCSDGSRVDCDAVVVGIGVAPRVELARAAGIATGNGIIVDRACRTSHPAVFAAGDVADQPGFFGGRARLETFQNASDQATAAAQAMLGRPVEYVSSGWAWTDQYDVNLQVVGRVGDGLSTVIRGSAEARDFSVFCLEGNVVVGALTVNRPRDMSAGRRMVERRHVVDRAMLADEAVPLMQVLKAARG